MLWIKVCDCWNCSQVNAKEHLCWEINIGSSITSQWSHCLSKCWNRSMLPYNVTNVLIWKKKITSYIPYCPHQKRPALRHYRERFYSMPFVCHRGAYSVLLTHDNLCEPTPVKQVAAIVILSNICRAWTTYLCMDSVKFLLEAPGASILWGHYYFVTTGRSIWGYFY